jgi:hypothetical protein
MMRQSPLIFCLLLLACASPVSAQRSDGPVQGRAPFVGRIASNNALAHSLSTVVEPLKGASLCAQDEKTIWSCETAGRKTVSICGARSLDKESGYVQYRFGRPGHVELEYPRQRQHTQTAFTYFRYTRPLVTFLGLRFKIDEYEYEVYDNSNEEAGAHSSEAGVTVTPAGNTAKAVDYRCRKPVVHHLIDLEEVVPNTEMTLGGP